MPSLPALCRFLLIALTVSCLLATRQADAVPRPGQTTPNFKVTSTTGQAITLDNFNGHVLILDFFATWCTPCRQSIPHLVEMNRKYGKQGLQILGLSVDEGDERAVKAFTNEFRVNYPVALAGDTTMVNFGVRSVPIMYMVDKKGKIVEVYRGYSGDTAHRVEESIKRLLAE